MILEERVGEEPERWIAVWSSDHLPDTSDDKVNDIDRRNYKRFAAIAGVRGEGPAPKGVPPHPSELTRFWAEDADLHSPTWYPLSEAVSLYNEPRYVGEDAGDLTTQSFCKRAWGGAESDYRVVFFFDN